MHTSSQTPSTKGARSCRSPPDASFKSLSHWRAARSPRLGRRVHAWTVFSQQAAVCPSGRARVRGGNFRLLPVWGSDAIACKLNVDIFYFLQKCTFVQSVFHDSQEKNNMPPRWAGTAIVQRLWLDSRCEIHLIQSHVNFLSLLFRLFPP